LTNIEVDRLPQKSLASIIAIEAHVLSQAQAADAMLRQQGICLHLDGTKKRFTEYSGFQISTEEGTFSLSHRIMPCGDEGSYLKATNDTFFELAELNDPDEKQEETAAKPKMVIKSIMTDRHVVNKAYKKMLENKKLKAIEEIEGTNKTEDKKRNGSYKWFILWASYITKYGYRST
jgi:hypothetical protein